MTSRTRALFLAARPKTLTAALVPVLVGTALPVSEGRRAVLWISAFAFLSALMIQIGTNLFNDAIDFMKGADKETRLGPSRATQQGWLSARAVLLMGVSC